MKNIFKTERIGYHSDAFFLLSVIMIKGAFIDIKLTSTYMISILYLHWKYVLENEVNCQCHHFGHVEFPENGF